MPRDITLHMVRFYRQRWGVYIRSDAKLRKSSTSILGRMIIEGPGTGQATAPIIYEDPEGVTTMQSIYRNIPDELKDVLRVKYIENRRNEIARRLLGLSMRVFRESLCQAEGHVQVPMRFSK